MGLAAQQGCFNVERTTQLVLTGVFLGIGGTISLSLLAKIVKENYHGALVEPKRPEKFEELSKEQGEADKKPPIDDVVVVSEVFGENLSESQLSGIQDEVDFIIEGIEAKVKRQQGIKLEEEGNAVSEGPSQKTPQHQASEIQELRKKREEARAMHEEMKAEVIVGRKLKREAFSSLEETNYLLQKAEQAKLERERRRRAMVSVDHISY